MKPYYADELVTLYQGRFENLLPEVLAAHGEPDLVCTDPPYGETSLAWDRWPDGWPALMPGKSMWCFGSMRMFLEHRDEFADWKLSQDVIWEKHNGSGFATDRFSRVHEHALHWYRGDWGSIHHDTPRFLGGAGNKHVPKRHTTVPHTGKIGSVPYVDDGKRLARSVIRAQSMHGTAINPTEKPAGPGGEPRHLRLPSRRSGPGRVRRWLLHPCRRPQLWSPCCGGRAARGAVRARGRASALSGCSSIRRGFVNAPIEHGTTRGHYRCQRRPEGACGPCKAAKNAYMRRLRSSATPQQKEWARKSTNARNKALWRLADIYRDHFNRLVDEELEAS